MTTQPPWKDADVNRVLAVFAGLIALAGPRKTRPLAGVLYGLFLSRVHGAAKRRLESDAYRAALGGGRLHAAHARRLDRLEFRHGFEGRSVPPADALAKDVRETDAWLRQVEEADHGGA